MARSGKRLIECYLNEVAGLSNEASRSQRFSVLLADLYGSDDPFVLEYSQGFEKYIKTEQKDRALRGRADNLTGNIIIEFESDIRKKLDESIEQLSTYTAILWNEEGPVDRRPYLCIATDGQRFHSFTPGLAEGHTGEIAPGDIVLEPIEACEWKAENWEEVLFWLDRYFLRREILPPATENIIRDFGVLSHAFLTSKLELLESWNKLKSKSAFSVMYDNWGKYLRIVYGEKVAADELFIRHTYLATLAKLMAWIRIEETGTPTSKDAKIRLISGEWFKDRGIENFLEEDFFSWIARPEAEEVAIKVAQRLFSLLAKYDFSKLSEDVLKSLYQEIVDPKTRHDLGEFYTPDWLAHRIINKFMDENPKGKFLDPACGSGTFLYLTIREKIKRLGDSSKTLRHILESVSGCDIHPLAAIIAKLNYLLALGSSVRRTRKSIRIPVYLADMLKLPELMRDMKIAANNGALEQQLPGYYFFLEKNIVQVPEKLIESTPVFDHAVEICSDFCDKNKGKPISLDRFKMFVSAKSFSLADDSAVVYMLYKIAEILKDYIDSDRDTIWSFVLKNSYKPLFLMRRADYIIGNPPWIVLRSLEPVYQEFLKSRVANCDSYNICADRPELTTHLEVGTLFLIRSADLYLKEGGKIGFVLPKSIFSSDQHDGLRRRSYKFVNSPKCKLDIQELWDCENVEPLFNVPCSVVIAKKDISKGTYHSLPPMAGEAISGSLSRKNASLEEADKNLNVRNVEYRLHIRGKRSYWSTDELSEQHAASVYKKKFAQGASIVPRSMWFVEPVRTTFDIQMPNPLVQTSQRAKREAKEPYKSLAMEGNIEGRFLFATLLSSDLIPFGHFDFRLTVLPIMDYQKKYKLLTASEVHNKGYYDLYDWLVTAEKEWEERRGTKAHKMDIYQRLDRYRGLTSQNPRAKYMVVYNTSGTHLASCVINLRSLTIPSTYIEPAGFIADTKTYYYSPKTANEAKYLASILNSKVIDSLIKPMQARGLWGPRDIHKKVLEFPIPKFKADNDLHKKLARLGNACTRKVDNWMRKGGPGKVKSVGKMRSMVRDYLKRELAEIDKLARELLKIKT